MSDEQGVREASTEAGEGEDEGEATVQADDVAPEPPAGAGRIVRIGLALTWVGLVCFVLFGGVLGDLTVDEVVERVRGAGGLGIGMYILAFGVLQPMGVSAHLFTASAGLIWPPWMAIPIAIAGALTSASFCYGFARFIAYDWVQARLPENLKKYEAWLVERGLYGVIVFRLVTFTSQPAMIMMGTTRVRFPTMLLGSAIGFIPFVCLGVLLGDQFLRYLLGLIGM